MSTIQEALKKAQANPDSSKAPDKAKQDINSPSPRIKIAGQKTFFIYPFLKFAVFILLIFFWVAIFKMPAISSRFFNPGPKVYTKNSNNTNPFTDFFKKKSAAQNKLAAAPLAEKIEAEAYSRTDETMTDPKIEPAVKPEGPMLNGIMFAGAKPLAIIGDSILGEGETSGDIRVIKILTKAVEVDKNGERITLTLSQ